MAEKRFIYAVDMDKLKQRIEDARKEAMAKAQGEFEAALHVAEDIEAAEDWKARFEYLAQSVQDFERGVLSKDELMERLAFTLEHADVSDFLCSHPATQPGRA